MADRKSLEELCLDITRFKLRARRKFHSMDDMHMVNEYSTGNQTYPERSKSTRDKHTIDTENFNADVQW